MMINPSPYGLMREIERLRAGQGDPTPWHDKSRDAAIARANADRVDRLLEKHGRMPTRVNVWGDEVDPDARTRKPCSDRDAVIAHALFSGECNGGNTWNNKLCMQGHQLHCDDLHNAEDGGKALHHRARACFNQLGLADVALARQVTRHMEAARFHRQVRRQVMDRAAHEFRTNPDLVSIGPTLAFNPQTRMYDIVTLSEREQSVLRDTGTLANMCAQVGDEPVPRHAPLALEDTPDGSGFTRMADDFPRDHFSVRNPRGFIAGHDFGDGVRVEWTPGTGGPGGQPTGDPKKMDWVLIVTSFLASFVVPLAPAGGGVCPIM